MATQGTFLGMVWWTKAATNTTIQSFLCKRYNMTSSQVVAVSNALSKNLDNKLVFEVGSSSSSSSRSNGSKYCLTHDLSHPLLSDIVHLLFLYPQEMKHRFITSKPDEAEQALLDEEIQLLEDLLWRQMYAADVLAALKHDPKATLKPSVPMEYGFYTLDRLGVTAQESGVTQDQLICFFELGAKNRTMFVERILGMRRSWMGDRQAFTNDRALEEPLSRDFDECFPTPEVIEVSYYYSC